MSYLQWLHDIYHPHSRRRHREGSAIRSLKQRYAETLTSYPAVEFEITPNQSDRKTRGPLGAR